MVKYDTELEIDFLRLEVNFYRKFVLIETQRQIDLLHTLRNKSNRNEERDNYEDLIKRANKRIEVYTLENEVYI